MSNHLLYVIGVPGCGKTALVRHLVLGRRRRVRPDPFAHTVYEDGLVQLGRDRAGHGGTDALSMSVQPKVVAALAARPWERVLGEGDRLANIGFLNAAWEAGYKVDVALVIVSREEAERRRNARGSSQDPKWLKGRETKLAGLWERVKEHPGIGTLVVNNTAPLDEVVSTPHPGWRGPVVLLEHPVIRT